MVMDMCVYERVRLYLRKNHIHLHTIAKQSGMPGVAFYAMLHGCRPLYADELRAICLALQVPPETLIEGWQSSLSGTKRTN